MDRRDFLAATAVMAVTPPLRAGKPPRLEELTLADMASAFAAGSLTSQGLTQRYLGRIDALDRRGPALRAVIEVNPRACQNSKRTASSPSLNAKISPRFLHLLLSNLAVLYTARMTHKTEHSMRVRFFSGATVAAAFLFLAFSAGMRGQDQKPPDPSDIAEGMRLFHQKANCQACHGGGRRPQDGQPDA